jgi:hypothetical protein
MKSSSVPIFSRLLATKSAKRCKFVAALMVLNRSSARSSCSKRRGAALEGDSCSRRGWQPQSITQIAYKWPRPASIADHSLARTCDVAGGALWTTFGLSGGMMKALVRLGFLIAVMATTFLLAGSSVRAGSDPLPSWNDGPTKHAIVEFIRATTDPSSAKFTPPEERVAVFDQDGTLWASHPIYPRAWGSALQSSAPPRVLSAHSSYGLRSRVRVGGSSTNRPARAPRRDRDVRR